MAELPATGPLDVWGGELKTWLLASRNADGSLSADAVQNALGGSIPALSSVPGYATDEANGNNLIIGADPANIVPGQLTNAHGNVAVGIGWRGSLPQTGSLGQITTGYDNTAIGNDTLVSLTTGHSNVAVGADAVSALTTGSDNVGVGSQAGEAITTGSNNIAIGAGALVTATTAVSNVAIGTNSLSVGTGDANTAIGGSALGLATTATKNVAIGYQAGYTANSANATVVSSRNVWIGYQSGPSGASDPADAVAIGHQALALTSAVAIGSGTNANANGAVALGRDSSGTAVSTSVANQIALGTVNHHILLKTKAAPADASLAASQFTLWLTDTPSGAKLNIKAKDSAGTVVAGTVALS